MKRSNWGIQSEYLDATGNRKTPPEKTIQAIEAAMGAAKAVDTSASSAVRVVRPNDLDKWTDSGKFQLEDGGTLRVTGQLPADFPVGYHKFRADDSGTDQFIISSPGRCYLPQSKIWGWAVQLYSARSQNSWGIGDFADLRSIARWAREGGAAIVLVNPLSANAPTIPQEDSPYSPSSRRFRNLLYLRIEDIPGATDQLATLRAIAQAGHQLNALPLIERDKVFTLKKQALEHLYQHFRGSEQFESYVAQQGLALHEFAVYCSLAESFGNAWRRWPAEYREPGSTSVAQFAAANRNRVQFHQWIQWCLDQQLSRAAKELPVMQDLPIGVDPGGADAWCWQSVLASGMAIGAPPDIHNTRGQNWGLPPWIPHKLRATNYQPFIETIRAMLQHAGGLRIDHALGLFRLFWIPEGADPSEGAFVQYPHEELLAIIAIESQRAGAFIVAEDLGTTQRKMQVEFANHGLLSYRLLWFEKDSPKKYPALSLAAVTTHDLPTIAGLWSGSDLADQQAAGCKVNAEATAEIIERVSTVAAISPTSPATDVAARLHELLAESGSLVALATLEDALGEQSRPNMPSATRAWPNWRRPMPCLWEECAEAKGPQSIANVMSSYRHKRPPGNST